MVYESTTHMNRSGCIVTVDGPAGSGKSTVARIVAERLGFLLLDSGALYRVMALHLLHNGVIHDDANIPDALLRSIDLHLEPAVGSQRFFLAGEEVTAAIRTEQVGMAASKFATIPDVRTALLALQRSIGANGNIVAEGRDMGTVVFPEALCKFFLTATLLERARRRFRELMDRGETPELQRVVEDMRARDLRDESREVAPLVQASDAVLIDTTNLTADEVIDGMIEQIRHATNRGQGRF